MRRRNILILVLAVSVAVVGFGLWSRVWLWDDYRDGYTAGVNLQGTKPANTWPCGVQRFGVESPQVGQLLSAEDEAWLSGCGDGMRGEPDNWWDIPGRLRD
ncbi:MAG: hypothetical protein ACJ72Y_06810 [Actinomycetes bacterium]